MKKEFRLIKLYPDSIPVGTIITFSSYDAEGFCYGCDDSGQVRIEDVREHPEFWEEVITPQTELTYTKMVSEEEFLSLTDRVKQLEIEVHNLKIKLCTPVNPLYQPRPWWGIYPPMDSYNHGETYVTTTTDKINIDAENTCR